MVSPRTSSGELRDAYRVPGFIPRRVITGVDGDPHARVVTLTRRAKKQSAGRVGPRIARGMITGRVVCAICRVGMYAFISRSISGVSRVGVVAE